MVLSQLLSLFLTDRKIKGCTPATLASYNGSIGPFVAFVLRRNGDVEADEIEAQVIPYLLALQDRELAQATRYTYAQALKVFTRFLYSERYVGKAISLPKVKPSQLTITPLTSEQMKRALGAVDTNRFTGLRNHAILRLFYDTGVRLSELAGIQLPEIDWEERFILVRGKGRKERWVPFGGETRKTLWTYVKQRGRVAAATETRLFVTQEGKRLTARGIQMVFKRLQKELALEGVRFSPHTLRHSFALAYVENGGDPFSLQRILGHTTQLMTSKYINMARSNLKAQHGKFSPGDRI